MSKLPISEFAVIPFVSSSELSDRFICTLTFYDGEWHSWLEAENRLLKVIMWPAESVYFGTTSEQPTDLCFHFSDLIAQRASFTDLGHALLAIHDDIFNLSASLAKVRWMHQTKGSIKDGISRMVATEVEYIFTVCRSILDLWQEIMSGLWDRITLTNSKHAKRKLKRSYQDMLFSSGQLQAAEAICKRYGIPAPMGECYATSASFFTDLRKFRDLVVHRGVEVPTIFDGENDFLIQEERIPFRTSMVWRADERRENNLVCLMPALHYLVSQTLFICNEFSGMFENHFRLLHPIVPGMKLYLRGYFNEWLVRALEDASGRSGSSVLMPG